MGNSLNLVGNRYGRLIVLNRSDKDKWGNYSWICQCDCGTVVVVSGRCLRHGDTKSCGCLKAAEDISGNRYGRLVVVEYFGKDSRGKLKWKCLCDCGNTIIIRSDNILSGNTRSCGCLNSELRRQRLTTHGQSYTKSYNTTKTNRRREMILRHDSEWTEEMSDAIMYYFDRCVICGSMEDLEIDHVYPLSEGYGLRPGNAIVLCKSHNSSKKDRNIDDLPDKMGIGAREIILTSASDFLSYWESLSIAPIASGKRT